MYGRFVFSYFLEQRVHVVKHSAVVRYLLGGWIFWRRENPRSFTAGVTYLVNFSLGDIDPVVNGDELVSILAHSETDTIENVVSHRVQVLQSVHYLSDGLLFPQVGKNDRYMITLSRHFEAQTRPL